MKILKFGLRFWITAASVLSFVGGWIMLVHAPKPYQLFQRTTAQALEPLPPLSDFGTGNNVQSQSFFQPRQRNAFFRTGGS
jgi:hypothetical protein